MISRLARIRLFLVVAVMAILAELYADRIYLKNGRVIEGRIVSETDQLVQVEAGAVMMPLRRDMIERIEQAQPYDNTLLMAEGALQRRDPARGIDNLFAAMKLGADSARIDLVLRENRYAISRAIEEAGPEERATIGRTMRRLLQEDFLTSRTLFYMSQQFSALLDFDAASDALRRIPASELDSDPEMRAWALAFMRQSVKRRLGHNDFEGALAYVETMRRLSDDDEGSNLAVAQLARYATARDAHDYATAFEIIAYDLQPVVPEIARNRAIYTINHMKYWSAQSGQFAECRQALKPIRFLFPVEYITARNYLVELEGQRLYDEGKVLEAMNLFDSIPPLEKTDEMRRIYDLAYHENTLQQLGEDDPLELLRHGQWCVEQGLLDQAIQIFVKTRENPSLRDLSDQLLTNTRRERDTDRLEEAQRLYDEGNVTEVINICQQIITDPGVESRLTEEAVRLDELARKYMKREAEARGPRAVVEYQQAERAYFSQDFENALGYLNVVLTRYPDTPAAAWAAELLPDVVRALELSYIEGRTTRLPELPEQFQLDTIQRTEQLDSEVKSLLELLEANQ